MHVSRRLFSILLATLASLAIVTLLAVTLMHTSPSHAASPAGPKSHALVTIADAPNTTTATFSPTSVTLTHNTKGKASIHFLNQTTVPQTINEVGGKSYTVKAHASVVVAVAIGSTTFSLQSNSSATLTVTVK